MINTFVNISYAGSVITSRYMNRVPNLGEIFDLEDFDIKGKVSKITTIISDYKSDVIIIELVDID